MKLIIGLGNPGKKYQQTKHNVGFITIDELAYQIGAPMYKSKHEALYTEVLIKTEKIILIKPQTFMNESGRSIRMWMDYFDVPIEDVLIIYDDMDLETGHIRLREHGGSGGHNGVKSIIHHVGTQAFKRIKIGIGRPYPNQSVISHVLSVFPEDVHDDMLHAVRLAVEASKSWMDGQLFGQMMNQFNG